MNHIQLTITANEEEQEQLIAELSELDSVGFEQTENALIAYFDEAAFKSYEVLQAIKEYEFSQAIEEQKNWNEEWEKGFEPVIVDNFCAVRASFHQSIKGIPHEIIITPKMSFGTGHHATTYMMIQQMRALSFADKTIFDFGTGTGVLAILAEKLGARSVVAIDNDKWSVENSMENIENNNCSKIIVSQSAVIPSGQKFDVVLANINRNIILEYLPLLKEALNPTGYIIFSGLLTTDQDAIVDACQPQALKLITQAERSNWLSLVFVNGN